MANRPFFIPNDNKDELVKTELVEFKWFSGFAKVQKQKSISSFHENISKQFRYNKILEISTKSKDKLGVKPPVMSQELEEKLCNLFIDIEKQYAKHCPNNRVNFLNYYFF